MPKVCFALSLPLNLYYHLQICCQTSCLRNEGYRRRFSNEVLKEICGDFSFLQDHYWFMQRFFIEALGRSSNIDKLDESFVSGVSNYAKELLPRIKFVLKKAYKLYEPYWKERLPYLSKMKDCIEKRWRTIEKSVFDEIEKITRVRWKTDVIVVQLVDSLSYEDLVLGEGHYAIGVCEPEVFIHVLIHELIHFNILDGVRRVHIELDLSQNQEDAINETFARLIEYEVTKRVAPWAHEPIEQKREEAKNQGFLEFFDVVLKDWANYLCRPERYPTIIDFMREEAIKRQKELSLAKVH